MNTREPLWALADFRVTFVGPDAHRWALARAHEVPPEQRDQVVSPAVASRLVADWSNDPDTWPQLFGLFEEVSGGLLRAPSARDIAAVIAPAISEAIDRGDIVALREPRETLELEGTGTLPRAAPPKPARKVVDKHFLDVTVVDDDGTPLKGRRYRLQLPSGIKEEGRLDGSARIFKPNVDEGSARLWLLPEDKSPTDQQTFTICLVDEIGTPISEVPLSFAHGIACDDATTGGDGKASITDSVDAATAMFSDVDALKKAVHDRWNSGRDGDVLVDSDQVTVVDLHGDLPSIHLQPGVTQTVSVQPYVERGRLLGGYFDTSKSFLLPSGLDGVRGIVSMYGDNEGSVLLIVGHTDTAGSSDYNDKLSLERAKSLKDYLMENVDGWLSWYDDSAPAEKRWGSLEDREMIDALPDASARDPGDDAVTWYQTTRGLKVDGIAGPDTRRALVGEYMGLEGTSLPASITPVVHGCGKNFPADLTPDGVADPANRRVEVFFFDGDLGVQPPASGDNSGPGATDYPEWVKRSKATTDHEAALAATGFFMGGTDVAPDSSEAEPQDGEDEATLDVDRAGGDIDNG